MVVDVELWCCLVILYPLMLRHDNSQFIQNCWPVQHLPSSSSSCTCSCSSPTHCPIVMYAALPGRNITIYSVLFLFIFAVDFILFLKQSGLTNEIFCPFYSFCIDQLTDVSTNLNMSMSLPKAPIL